MNQPPAVAGETHEVELADIAFETMFRVLCDGGSLDQWNQVFSEIVQQVSARVRAKFRDRAIADSAAQSAMATIIRRARDGALEGVDGPDAFIGQVVLRAHHKAWEKLRARWRYRQLPEGFDPEDPCPPTDPEPDPDGGHVAEAIRREMEYQLNAMLTRMNLLLKSEQRRKTFELLYRKMCGIERLTDAEIAARLGISERTVRRVRQQVEEHWPVLVEEGLRAVRALEAGLR